MKIFQYGNVRRQANDDGERVHIHTVKEESAAIVQGSHISARIQSSANNNENVQYIQRLRRLTSFHIYMLKDPIGLQRSESQHAF